jgi:DNA-binding response OmpR family regulator
MSSTDRPILVVEDDTDDLFLLQKAFEKSGLTKELMIARDGEMAIEVLSNENIEHPALVILDLKLPRKSGFEVLEWLGARGALARMRVIVLSSSTVPSDVQRAYALGVISYHAKPAHFQELKALTAEICRFWREPWEETPKPLEGAVPRP